MTRLLTSLLLLACALPGCTNDGVWLQTWWGPTDSGEGDSPFPPGGSFQVQGFAHRVTTASARDLVEVVLVGAEQDVTCDAYRRFLAEVSELQTWVDDVLAHPADERPDAWVPYVCQELRGAASDAFGGGGAYRSIHALAEVTGGSAPSDGVFRGAVPGSEDDEFGGGELLVPGSFVSRSYERSQHGDGILPQNSGGDDAPWRRACLSPDAPTECDIDPDRDCAGYLSALVEDAQAGRTTYPDRASMVLQAASHRYYHHHKAQDTIQIRGAERPLGLILPGWEQLGTAGGDAEITYFGDVSRAPSIFPYKQVLVSSQGDKVPVEACPDLSETAGMVWPEVSGLPGGPSAGGAGDDDDSTGDDDDSAGGDDDDSSR